LPDAVHVPVDLPPAVLESGIYLVEGVTGGHASAVLAASMFSLCNLHDLPEAKAHMAKAGLPMRLSNNGLLL